MHCHYLNPAVNQKIAHLNPGQYDPTTVFANTLTRETNVKQMATRAPKLAGVTERLKDMDKMGVDIQAVCPAPYHFLYWTDRDMGAALTREVNDGIAKVVADTPDRFVGMGSVPLQDADLAVKELEYCVKTLGFRGIEICTSVNGKNLTDPDLKLEKFFARAEELGDTGPGEQVGPQVLHVAGPVVATALDAEPDVGAAAGEGERPEVAGQQVGLERHEELGRSLRRDVRDVLAEGVPLAEVAGPGDVEQLAERRVHAVGADDPPGPDPAQLVHGDHGRVRSFLGVDDSVAFYDLGAGRTGDLDQRGVELSAGCDGGEPALAVGEREHDLATPGRADAAHVDVLPAGNGRRVEPERLQPPERSGGQAVAADLVTRERGLVDDKYFEPGTGQCGCGGSPGRAGPDHHHVDGAHLRPGRAARRTSRAACG
jgi:hypothetical protein